MAAELNRPPTGPNVISLLEGVNARLKKLNRETEAQALSPAEITARLECYADIQRLLNDALDSIVRSHPELSALRVPR